VGVSGEWRGSACVCAGRGLPARPGLRERPWQCGGQGFESPRLHGLGAAGKAFAGEAANIASGLGSAARGLANAVRPGATPLWEGASALVDSAASRGVGGAARESMDAGSNNVGVGAKPSCHSFDPKMPVLLADGSTKQIKDIKLGDRVLATGPAAGATAPKWASESCLGRYTLIWVAAKPSRTCLPPAGS
jgi:hypothetical protein